MSFATKYKHIFKDYNNDTWEFHLQKDGYSGSEYTLNGTGSPIRILDANQNGDKFTPIRGTSLKANLYIDTDAAYDFNADFQGTTDREWQALLYKASGSTYLGTCQITNLSITNTNTDATGSITITHIGGSNLSANCNLRFTLYYFPASDISLKVYAVPAYEDNQSTNRILMSLVTVLPTDDTEDVVDKIVASSVAGKTFTKVSANEVKLELTTYNSTYAAIDSTWTLTIEYAEDQYKPYSILVDNRFVSSIERQFIKVDLISQKEASINPNVISLAEHYYESGETTSTIADDLATQIDGTNVVNIIDPVTDELLSFTISASAVSNVITLTLYGIGANGNNFDILSSLINSSYIRVYSTNPTDYTWTDVDFSGGVDSGDYFRIQADIGGGNYTIAETIAYLGDTSEEIISRLNTKLNADNVIFNSEIDANDATKLNIYTETSGYTYVFSTDGASTVTPIIDTSFALQTKNVVKWRGWVIPGFYSRPHLTGIYPVELTALDGLGDLKNFNFESDDSTPFQKISIIKTISDCLANTGFNLNIYESFDLWHTQGDSALSPLSQVYQDASRLNGLDSYSVLEELVTLLKATITQIDSSWRIIPLDQIDSSYTQRVFDHYGNYIESITRDNFIKDTGGTTRDFIFINRSAKIDFEPAFRTVTTEQDYGLSTQLLKFPSFNSIVGNIDNLQYPWKWGYNDSIQYGFLSEVGYTDDGFLSLNTNMNHYTEQYYLEQIIPLNSVILYNNYKYYQFNLSYKQQIAGFSFKVEVFIKNKAETHTYWLSEDIIDNSNYLQTTQNFISIDTEGEGGVTTLNVNFFYPTYDSNFDDEPSNLYVRIYQPVSNVTGRVQIKSCEFIVDTTLASGKKVTSYYDELVNEMSSEQKSYKFSLGDVPNIQNATLLFKNALYYYDADNELKITSGWVTNPDSPTDQKMLIDHLRKFILENYPIPIIKLSADVLGGLWLSDVLKDKSNSDKLFLCVGGEMDIKNSVISGEWQEIDTDVSGYTLVNSSVSLSDPSSGTNQYTTTPGNSTTEIDIDLTKYYTQDQVNNLLNLTLKGFRGSFLGSDLTNKQITIDHNLAIDTIILYLYDNNNNMIAQSNYEIDTGGDINSLTLTVHMPTLATDVFKYRII